MTEESKLTEDQIEETGTTRRDFVVLSATALGCVGAAASIIPFIDSLAPDQAVLAVGSTEVDLSKINLGDNITVMWRGQPVFIRHRKEDEIKAAADTPLTDLKDPQDDKDRVKSGHEQWLVTIGVCTHLGCVPLSNKGEYNGWFCPCHGSVYDTSGRIRSGPAPLNLAIPPYDFINDTTIKIG